MKTSEELKQLVKKKYASIATQEVAVNKASCCGSGEISEEVYNIMTDDYAGTAGYNAEADLGLGCGLPTKFAQILHGDTVIDLGSGAGNDCFIARHETGQEGRVIGIDFTDEMVRKARRNAEKLGLNNVEFRLGDIEEMPVSDQVADVVVSNCVLNLVPDKEKVFSEIFRVLKPGGHFSISDIVLEGELPEALKEDAEMYAGCVSGAIQKEQYLRFIKAVGFENVTIQQSKPIRIPDDILDKYLDDRQKTAFHSSKTGVFSITVFASKPGAQARTPLGATVGNEQPANCGPGSGCC